MSKISKKLISLVLALVLSFSVCTVAFAAAALDFNMLEDDTATITGCDGMIENGVLELYDYDDFYEVDISAVSPYAFAYDSSDFDRAYIADITSIVVAAGIKEIGASAFADLPALNNVTFKGDITVDEDAFLNCAALTTVTFEKGAHLNKNAFAGCTALDNLVVKDAGNFAAAIGSLSDTVWYKNFKSDFVTIGTTLISYKGAAEEITIPDNITAIGASAFEGNDALKKVVLSDKITEIGDNAFADCTSLEEIVFPEDGSVSKIGKDAFQNTPFFDNYPGEFFIMDGVLVKYMGKGNSFVQIPNTVTAIADDAFDGSYTYSEENGYTFEIEGIVVPASVTKVGKNALSLKTDEDGTTKVPEIFAYYGTDAIKALKNAGYKEISEMPDFLDLDKNGKIDTEDARAALRIALDLDDADAPTRAAADADGDNNVTTEDARLILRIALDLDEYSSEGFLLMPRTKTEVLMAYTSAMKKAASAKAGYTKKVTGEITDSDVNLFHKSKIENIAKRNMVNTTKTYSAGSKAAVANLAVPTLLSTENIKSVSNVRKDGKYYITIVLNDVRDAYVTASSKDYTPSDTDLNKIIPVVNGQVFYNAISSNSWFNLVAESDTRTFNCVRKYAMDYVDPTVKVVLDAETMRPVSVTMSCLYDFAVSGKINGVEIASTFSKNNYASVERTDTITYSDFVW